MKKEIINILLPSDAGEEERRMFYLGSPYRFHGNSEIRFGSLRSFGYVYLAPGYTGDYRLYSNKEILIIPLYGELTFKRLKSNSRTMSFGGMQIISAGEGIEYRVSNPSETNETIYVEIQFEPAERDTVRKSLFYTMYSCFGDGGLRIVARQDERCSSLFHQFARVYMHALQAGEEWEQTLLTDMGGAFIFVLTGEVMLNDVVMKKGTGAYFYKRNFKVEALLNSLMIVIEVPLTEEEKPGRRKRFINKNLPKP